MSDAGIDIAPLPQCGFGTDIDFDSLIKSNRFLFRVYTPKERSPFADDTDPFFVAPRFDELVARSPIDPPNVNFSEPAIGSYAEVARHMEWTTRTSSCYVSTSFSFTWAIWEAVRRYHIGVKKDVEIAIIDSTALGGRAATAIQLLEKSSPQERNEQFWKWHRFSQDSQSVLVYGLVPRTAVLASIPLLQILRKMPSYFLRKDIQIISGNPLDQVAWDYTKRKHNYRQFCQEMTKVFLGKSTEVRLRDSTAGAVRLALSFLRPFFHNVVQDDFDLAISYLRTFAITISTWPGSWWVKDHPEVRQIVEVMVLSLGEELRGKYSQQKQEEISRLQLVISGLEQTIRAGQISTYHAEDVDIDSDGDFEAELEDLDEPTLVNRIDNTSDSSRPSLHMSVTVLPRIPISFQTPITPPESPRHSLFLPKVTSPMAEVTSASPLSSKVDAEDTMQIRDGQPVEKSSGASDEPASPPPTPPRGSPVFSPMQLSVIQEAEDVHEVGGKYSVRGGKFDHAKTDDGAFEDTEAKEVFDSQNEDLAKPTTLFDVTHLEGHSVREHTKQVEASDNLEVNSNPDDDIGHHGHYNLPSPASPSHSWILASHPTSPLSSRRSSIMSVDTLCEPIEFPLKRLSFATSYSDSFDFVRPMSSMGLSSRTISFSEHSPRLTFSVTPPVNVVATVNPPPLQLTTQTSEEDDASRHSTASVSRSTSSSSTSSTDSSSSNDSNLAFITPLPPSPTLSIASLSSTLTRTSQASSAPATPVADDPSHMHDSVLIPPKPSISLLSPLDIEYDEPRRARARVVRTGTVSETASYIVTGFLVGAFITLFLFSTQRRTMIYLT